MHYQFDDFTLNSETFELQKNKQIIKAEPQVIELLVFLVKNPDRMVSKDEILNEIWSGRFVSESALSSRIKSARKVLGDDGQRQKYIRTVHKKGFRFVCDVTVVEERRKSVKSNVLISSINDQSAEQIPHISRPKIAVLPFNNLSSDAEQEYFSDGITTDIITMLSKHRWLDVLARNTTFGYKNKAINVCELGKNLGVDYVLEGSVQQAGKRLRINAQLIDAHSGMQKWADRYDRDMVDIFDLQDEITEKIVSRLEPEIGFAERYKVMHTRPENLQAWDCYHLGIYHLFQFTKADNVKAQQLLEQSQQLDPRFGEAYAWWAYAVILGMIYWDTPSNQVVLDKALSACDTALSLDSQNASFYALRARTLLARKEYQRAIAENEMAISLNPTFAAAYCGLGDSLAYEGRYPEAMVFFNKAIALSPNDPQLWAFLTYGSLTCIFCQDFTLALAWAERASSIPNCQYWTLAHKAVALAYLDRIKEANATVKTLQDNMPDFSRTFAKEKLFYLSKQTQIDLYLHGLALAGVPE